MMSRQTKLRLLLAAILLLLIAVIGGYTYVRFHMHTPQYALEELEQSVKNHDLKSFQKHVNVDHVLDHSFDGLIEGLLDTGGGTSEEARTAAGNVARMMKAPILSSFRTAVEQYVTTGNWSTTSDEDDASKLDAADLLAQAGLHKTEFRQWGDIQPAEDENRVILDIHVYQQEADRDFVFKALMVKEDNVWCIDEIQNFRDFVVMVGKARRSELDQYLKSSAAVMEKHDRIIREAEQKYGDLLSAGSLGRQNTRDEIKALMEGTIQKDWEARKEELFSMSVPEAAQTLHHLRLRICDLYIEYARGYAAWMTDKKAATVREADMKLKEAKTLEQEARILSRRMEMAKLN